jgi:hypothetical protein
VLFVTGVRRLPRYLAHGLFPTIENMAAIYGRPPSAWLYAHYATLPFRALRRAASTRSFPPRT